MAETNGWVEYKRQVLSQLEQLNDVAKDMNIKIDQLRQDVTILKTKAGIYGAIAGIIVVIISKIIVAEFSK